MSREMGRPSCIVALLICLGAAGTAVPAGAKGPGRAGTGARNDGLIVFSFVPLVSVPGDIFVVEPDGSNLQNLTTHPAHDTMPAWSPDGSQIAFISNRDAVAPPLQWDVFVMNADGTEVRNVTRSPGASERMPDWSPDGTKLAFERHGNDGTSFLYTMNVDGSGERRLTRGGNPSWSPEGKWIAFDTGNDEAAEDWVLLIKPDGTKLRRLRTGDTDDSHPNWSPDGQRVVFSRDEGIVTVTRDGGRLRRVDPEEGSYELPSWSPNGRRLVVVKHMGLDPQIYTMDLRGGALIQVTSLPPGFPAYPDWRAAT